MKKAVFASQRFPAITLPCADVRGIIGASGMTREDSLIIASRYVNFSRSYLS